MSENVEVRAINKIFSQAMDEVIDDVIYSLDHYMNQLSNSEIHESWRNCGYPVKDQKLWDQLVFALQTLGVCNMSELRELNRSRDRWVELCEVWDQITPECNPEEILKLANQTLQNSPKELAWVRLWALPYLCC